MMKTVREILKAEARMCGRGDAELVESHSFPLTKKETAIYVVYKLKYKSRGDKFCVTRYAVYSGGVHKGGGVLRKVMRDEKKKKWVKIL